MKRQYRKWYDQTWSWGRFDIDLDLLMVGAGFGFSLSSRTAYLNVPFFLITFGYPPR